MPEPLIGFYKTHANTLVLRAVSADQRRYISPYEAARHYIDIDQYDPDQCWDVIPSNWCAAEEKFSADTLQKHGILPWQISWTFHDLVDAWKKGDKKQIIELSADLGHYISDAHVPLHTTKNYNGQLTDQHGIHGLWESRLPEIHFEQYSFWVGQATHIDSIQTHIWSIIQASHACVDSVLELEKQLSKQFPEHLKYGFELRNQQLQKTYSVEFSQAYHTKLQNMVERRMRASMKCVADFWYTAWVLAGSPNKLLDLSKEEMEALEAENQQIKLESAGLHDHEH